MRPPPAVGVRARCTAKAPQPLAACQGDWYSALGGGGRTGQGRAHPGISPGISLARQPVCMSCLLCLPARVRTRPAPTCGPQVGGEFLARFYPVKLVLIPSPSWWGAARACTAPRALSALPRTRAPAHWWTVCVCVCVRLSPRPAPGLCLPLLSAALLLGPPRLPGPTTRTSLSAAAWPPRPTGEGEALRGWHTRLARRARYARHAYCSISSPSLKYLRNGGERAWCGPEQPAPQFLSPPVLCAVQLLQARDSGAGL